MSMDGQWVYGCLAYTTFVVGNTSQVTPVSGTIPSLLTVGSVALPVISTNQWYHVLEERKLVLMGAGSRQYIMNVSSPSAPAVLWSQVSSGETFPSLPCPALPLPCPCPCLILFRVWLL